MQPDKDQYQRDSRIGADNTHQCFQQFVPGTFLPDRVGARRITFQKTHPACRDDSFSYFISRFGHTYHIGRKKGCYDRYGHNDRVKEIIRYFERQSQRGDDKGELTDLCQRETGLDGDFDSLSR